MLAGFSIRAVRVHSGGQADQTRTRNPATRCSTRTSRLNPAVNDRLRQPIQAREGVANEAATAIGLYPIEQFLVHPARLSLRDARMNIERGLDRPGWSCASISQANSRATQLGPSNALYGGAYRTRLSTLTGDSHEKCLGFFVHSSFFSPGCVWAVSSAA